MKRDLKTVRDLLGEKRDALTAIKNKCDQENRKRTDAEKQQWDDLQTEVRELTEEETFLREAAENEAIVAGRAGVQLGVVGNKTLSEKDQRDLSKFSLGAVIKRALNRETISGIDAEVVAEGRKEMDASNANPTGNILIPYGLFAMDREGRDMVQESVQRRSLAERRDMTATGTTSTTGDQGGMTIQTSVGRIFEALFNKLVLQRLGANFMPGLIGNLDLPRVVKGAAPTFKAENASATEISPTVTKSSLTPHRLPAYIDPSNQLLRQSEMNVQRYLENYLFSELSSLFDKAGISGAGSSNEPLGILSTSGIGAVYAGNGTDNSTNANGAALVWEDIVNLVKEIQIDNADVDNMAYLTNPLVTSKLQTTLKGENTGAIYLMSEGARTLNGYNVGKTNNVTSAISKGSSSTLSAMVFGNFQDLWMGMWGGIDILVDPYTQAATGTTRIHASLYCDAAVVRPESFSACKDIVA